MAPQIKEDVFKAIQEATTEKMPEEKVKSLANQVIKIFAENNLEYSQAYAVMNCIRITLVARQQLMKI